MTINDVSLDRRVQYLERRIQELELSLSRAQIDAKRVEPLSAKLWRFTANEDMGESTSNQMAADLVTLGGTDTLLDITVLDPLAAFSAMSDTDPGYCLEQLDIGGARQYIVLAPATASQKQLCRFTTDAAFDTTDASVQGDVITQFGSGSDHATTLNVTFNNLLTSAGGVYVFEGDSGDAGLALYSGSGTTWHIVQMECP